TRNNMSSYFVLRGRSMGFDYEMASLFADYLGVKLEVIVPEKWGDLIPRLQAGKADVIAAGMTATEDRGKKVRFSNPYALTHMRLVWGKGAKPVQEPEELAGLTLHIRQNSSYFQRLVKLNSLFNTVGKEPMDLIIEGESMETEQILALVAKGDIPYTLCDYHICRENQVYLSELVMGPRVSDIEALAWATHLEAAGLAAAVNVFFAKIRDDGTLKKLEKRYYETPRRRSEARKAGALKSKDELSKYDSIFKEAALAHQLDWRLLAAMAFYESHFDVTYESWNGGRGLFGQTPQAISAYGFNDPSQPKQAASAAALDLARAGLQYAGIKNEEDRTKISLAAIAVGIGHISDARAVALKRGLNPDSWTDLCTAFHLLGKPEISAKARHGYLRASEAIDFAEGVWGHYRSYRHAMGERD
ncbi:transporter substrate-binding domain-containing protein, partial [Myxococcota bacterium]|nr:transporter substrate-binding domain-containing protein [Myxococcota bacterium]